jgi:thiamine pyrophosphokinase
MSWLPEARWLVGLAWVSGQGYYLAFIKMRHFNRAAPMTVLVFANGELDEAEWIRPRLEAADAVIAADGGLRHVLALDRWPDVLIGDMDSLPPGAGDGLAAESVEIITFSHDKNETDLELALMHAAKHYSGPIEIYGAVGGRLDQTMANISLLAHPALEGREVRLMEPREALWLVTDIATITGAVGDTVSLIPMQGDVVVHATAGLRWPLQDETLKFGRARGVSNELVSQVATVEVASGQLLCVHTTQLRSDSAFGS